jgi:hypothetical protein
MSGVRLSTQRAADRLDGHPADRELSTARLGAVAAVANAAWTITSAFVPAGVVISGMAVIAVVAAIAATQAWQNTRSSGAKEST